MWAGQTLAMNKRNLCVVVGFGALPLQHKWFMRALFVSLVFFFLLVYIKYYDIPKGRKDHFSFLGAAFRFETSCQARKRGNGPFSCAFYRKSSYARITMVYMDFPFFWLSPSLLDFLLLSSLLGEIYGNSLPWYAQ